MGLPQNQTSLFQGTSDPELSSEWQKKAPKKGITNHIKRLNLKSAKVRKAI